MPPEPRNGSERKLLEDVASHGCHILHVAARADEAWEPPFSYSVGLWRSYNHPEIVVFGLSFENARVLINNVAELARSGEGAVDGTVRDDVWDPGLYDVGFAAVEREHYSEQFGFASWFYEGWDFPVLQMVVPAPTGELPGEAGYPDGHAKLQPLLGRWTPPVGRQFERRVQIYCWDEASDKWVGHLASPVGPERYRLESGEIVRCVEWKPTVSAGSPSRS